MRVICLLLVSIFALKVNAQQYTKFNGYGFAADRMRSDSISIHPSDTVRNKAARSIAVLNGVFYIADGTKWKVVGTDTTSLSNRINLKLNIADTASMLTPYLRKADTITLSNRIDARVKYTDTASMLSPYSKLKSVGLTMPSAFNVANSPLTSDGTLAVSGAGTAAQYVRGDGQLANFPSNGGGGSSVNYYLNGSVNQGTFGGDTYYQLSKVPIIGAGTNFTRTNAQGDGYIASFITDAGDPALLNIPGGNWNLEFYFNASSGGSNPSFYAEIYKVSSSNVFTLIASGSTNPEGITQGTVVDQYFTSIPVPQTTILATDRIAIRIFVTTSGRTITLHTENSNLCEVLTTFSTGLNALNGLTNQVQYFATGTSGTDFNISSATDTHTFNLPTASATNRGALSSANWTTFNGKIGAGDTATMLTPYSRGSGTSGQVGYWNATRSLTGSSNLFWDNANGRLGIGTSSPQNTFDVVRGTAGAMLRSQYESASFSFNADSKVGIYTASSNTAHGAGLIFGQTNLQASSAYPAFEMQYVYSATVADNNWRLNYTGRNSSGLVTTFAANLFNVYADGRVILNPAASGVTASAKLLIGTSTDAGFRLDVNGTARVQGAATVSLNQNSSTILTVSNTTAGTGSQANMTLTSDATAGNGQLFKYSSSRPAYKTINSSDLGFYNATGGNISILNDNASGNINFTAGASSNAQLTIASSGNITQSVNQNASTTLKVSNTTSGTASESILLLTSNNGNFQFGKTSSTKTAFKTISANDGYIFNDVSGNISILNNFASGNINFAAGGSSNSHATLASNGNLLIGTTTDIASSKLTVESTTQGFLPPRMTTAQRDLISSPAAGLIIYNTSTNKHQGYNGSTWNDFY